MNIRFLSVRTDTCVESYRVQLISHVPFINVVIIECWEEGLWKRANIKPADVKDITDIFFFLLFIHQASSWAVLYIYLPHVPHISALLFIALRLLPCPHFAISIEAQQLLCAVK